MQCPGAVAAGDVAGGQEQQILLPVDKEVCLTSFEEDMEAEKHRVLRKVDEDMLCLKRIYSDLADTAEEQQATFDTIESHMARAAVDIERGCGELQLASAGSWGQRFKRKLWIALAAACA